MRGVGGCDVASKAKGEAAWGPGGLGGAGEGGGVDRVGRRGKRGREEGMGHHDEDEEEDDADCWRREAVSWEDSR
jgi:hypothetical protein